MSQDGTNDDKFSVQIPDKDYETKATKPLLGKMKAFEEMIIVDAVKHSEEWWGEEMDRGILKLTFFLFIKHQKDKIKKRTLRNRYLLKQKSLFILTFGVSMKDLEQSLKSFLSTSTSTL